MSVQAAVLDATTQGGFLLVLSIVVPVTGVLLAFAAGGRQVEWIALATMPVGLAIAVAILVTIPRAGGHLVYLLGGWTPPLGIALRADALSAVMMAVSAVVICAVGIFARADFHIPAERVETRASFAFWILLLAIWAALNMVFVGGDLFTLYVALELLTFSAVPLVCLDGHAETLQAALRYLLFALIGSVLYLVGVAVLYGCYGTLDIVLLSQRVRVAPAPLIAAGLMTVGLLAKTALFPLHLWLPPAHAGAPAAASAVLSALVVKGSYFVVVRLWFDAMPNLMSGAGAQLLATLATMAIVFGSVLSLRQERLKLTVAYSTVAQIGYLFLLFPLAFSAESGRLESGAALSAGLLQAMSHATAKAALFMSAGLIYGALGHDQIARLAGIGRALPISVLAFALGGVALIGVPLSGAYLAKDLMLQAAAETNQWWWVTVLQVGGVFTSSYVLLVLGNAMAPGDRPITLRRPTPRDQEVAALVLALCALFLGVVPWHAYLSIPTGDTTSFSALKVLATTFVLIVGGAVLAILLGRSGDELVRKSLGKGIAAMVRPARSAFLVFSRIVERADGILRQWPAATLSLLVVGILFGVALLIAR
jgi:formate hydrogenlyase subunit 3/multisubunit Na+/H+ antiporter MnhD subunit